MSTIAGPLEECLYIENISLLTEPIVNKLGRTPGKDIVPKEGPSFPDEDIIIIFWLEAIVINSIIFLSLKLMPPNDKFIILHLSINIDSLRADISHSFFVTLDAVNILYIYISLSLAMPYFSPQIILDKYVPCPSISFSSVSSEKFFIFIILEHLAISLSMPESSIPIFIFCPLKFLFQNKYFVFK